MPEEAFPKPDASPRHDAKARQQLMIGVVVDWDRCPRGECWTNVLAQLNKPNWVPNTATLYPIADLIVGPPRTGTVASTKEISDENVIIVNWDTVNGDPEYGAHLALRWFEHRGSELITWVRQGGILIIEGQAVLGVPCQQAYNALVSSYDLPVCGAEDPGDPMLQRERWGYECKKTKHFPTSRGFGNVNNKITAIHRPTFDTYFPPLTDRLLSSDYLKTSDWSAKLYRGWFRRFSRRANLPWVSIIETADRPWLRNHATMKVARLDAGAIFVSTMFLASTGQIPLIAAILRCAGHVEHLPAPSKSLEIVSRHWKGFLTFGAMLLGAHVVEPLRHLIAALSKSVSAQTDMASDTTLAGIMRVAIPALGALFFEGMVLFYRGMRRLLKQFLGH